MQPEGRRRLFSRQVLLGPTAILVYLALLKLLLHFATSGQYGYLRDELYYLAASEHLDFGYIDYPPFVAVVTAVTRWLLGDSLFALHFFPAVAGALVVLLAGLMAQQLGGGRFAQGLAALAVVVAPVYLAVNSLLSMDAFDQLLWVLAAYIVLLILKKDEPRLWLLFGLVVGVGLMTKVTILYFGAALVVALLLTRSRKYLLNKWLWLGGLLALVIFSPYLLWQIAHGWPTLEFWQTYAAAKTYPVTPVEFLYQQIVGAQPLTLPLWIAGLFFYFFSKEGKRYRPLGWIYVILYIVFTVQQAKFYFLAATYPMLFASGALIVEEFIQTRRWHWLKPTYASLMVIGGLAIAPLFLPVLPVETFIRYSSLVGGDAAAKTERLQTSQLPQHFADRFGWQDMVATVGEVYNGLPPEDQSKSCILAGNYGQAGAVDLFGGAYALPKAISGHNNYYLWGPEDCTGEVVIAVGVSPYDLRSVFREVTFANSTRCRYCMPQENDRPIYICRDSKVAFDEAWRRFKWYE
jgi:4-amino-4-deoxy-L-arabinose transferase-like glycosyltransferase